MHNPFTGWPITGTWADHMSYSLGGTDYPLDYGTALPAPGAGTLHTSGRPGPGDEYQCGQVGSAGRRSILILDKPVGPMVAIVFQHQSKFGVDGKHYGEGEDCGWSGASADGDDWGGETHLHIHGLDAKGHRLDFTKYAGGSSVASSNLTPLTPKEDEAMFKLIHDATAKSTTWFVVGATGKRVGIQNTYHLELLQRFAAQTELLPAEIDLLAATYLSKIN